MLDFPTLLYFKCFVKISYNWVIVFKQILSISVFSFCYRVYLVSFISQIIFFSSTISILEETASPLAMPSDDRSSSQHLERTLPETMCLVTQLCLTLCDPMDCRGLLCPWGFSRQEHWSGLPYLPSGDLPNPVTEPRCPSLQADSLPADPPEKPKNTGMGNLSLLQGNFSTQESNQGLLHCRWILYQLNYQETLPGKPYQGLWTITIHLRRSQILNSESLRCLFF